MSNKLVSQETLALMDTLMTALLNFSEKVGEGVANTNLSDYNSDDYDDLNAKWHNRMEKFGYAIDSNPQSEIDAKGCLSILLEMIEIVKIEWEIAKLVNIKDVFYDYFSISHFINKTVLWIKETEVTN